ncbi:MAG: GNAT family N-acetyltransferase [Promethearchaeota archaeon]
MGTEKDSKSNFFNKSNNNQPFLIRKCRFKDLEYVKEVNEKELPEDYPFFFYKSILDNFPESFLVACTKSNHNHIIGYVMWRIEKTPSKESLRLVNKGHLVSIAISEGFRRWGIATALLTNSMNAIKKSNVSKYVLEVRISNYAAIELYKGFNFKIESVKKKYYRDGENAYYMVYKIKKD